MVKTIIDALNFILFRIGTRLSVTGYENIKRIQGGYIIAANHLGFLDAFLIYYLAWKYSFRKDLIVMVAEHWRNKFYLRFLVRSMNAVFIDRENADFRALREVLHRLARGGVLVVAPEGTRNPNGGLMKPKLGTAFLAAKSRLPVIPCIVLGTADKEVIQLWKRFKRPEISFTIGNPFRLPELDREDREAALQNYSDEIMAQIASMLPAELRGIYREHPRVLELSRLLESPG